MLDQMVKDASSSASAWSPAVDIYETADSVIMVAEVAGVSRKEIKVIVDGDVVRLYGHRDPTCCTGGARYHRMEMDSGPFVRSFRVQVPFVAQKGAGPDRRRPAVRDFAQVGPLRPSGCQRLVVIYG